MQEWYYSNAGSQLGPVTLNELRALLESSTLDASTTLVWKAGMADWIAAANVPELSEGESVPEAVSASLHLGATKQVASGSVAIDAVACLKRGFDLTVRHFGNALLAMLVIIFLPLGIMLVISALVGVFALFGRDNAAVSTIVAILMMVVMSLAVHGSIIWLLLGFNRFCLNAVSGQDAKFTDLFGEARRIIPAMIAGLLFGIAVSIGFMLLVVPGIYLLARYGFFLTAMVDRKCGVMDSFSYSSQLTENNRLNIVVLLLLSMIVSWLGALALGIGLLFAYPMIFIAWTVAYLWLQNGNRAAMDHPGTKVPMLSPLP